VEGAVRAALEAETKYFGDEIGHTNTRKVYGADGIYL